jgi:hypothetical protein
MLNKALLLVGLMLVLSPGFTAAAEEAAAASATVEEGGQLLARGAGYAKVHGSGAMDVSVYGASTIPVKGADVLRAEGRGRRWDLPGGGILFAGWRGSVHMTGKDLNVKMWDGILELNARGSGWALLKG